MSTAKFKKGDSVWLWYDKAHPVVRATVDHLVHNANGPVSYHVVVPLLDMETPYVSELERMLKWYEEDRLYADPVHLLTNYMAELLPPYAAVTREQLLEAWDRAEHRLNKALFKPGDHIAWLERKGSEDPAPRTRLGIVLKVEEEVHGGTDYLVREVSPEGPQYRMHASTVEEDLVNLPKYALMMIVNNKDKAAYIENLRKKKGNK